LLRRKIVRVDEAARVEFLRDARVAPIDRHAARPHGLDDLLGRVTRDAAVLERHVKFIALQEFMLGLRLQRDALADIIARAACRMHLLVSRELLKKIPSVPRVPAGLAREKAAKLLF